MRKNLWIVLFGLAAATGCAKTNEEGELPADTATLAPAPMPMDTGMMQMDSAAHDSMMMQQPTTGM